MGASGMLSAWAGLGYVLMEPAQLVLSRWQSPAGAKQEREERRDVVSPSQQGRRESWHLRCCCKRMEVPVFLSGPHDDQQLLAVLASLPHTTLDYKDNGCLVLSVHPT